MKYLLSVRGALLLSVLAAMTALLAFQVLIPPVIGLADQSDFKRITGRFGFAPEHADRSYNPAWVEPKYVPNSKYRDKAFEQFGSEYVFMAAAVAINALLSRDGTLDIRVMGFVHVLAFLAIFARFLWVTRNTGARWWLWIGALLIFSDVGYVAYWNSFYSECASGLAALWLLTESAEMTLGDTVSRGNLIRWIAAAVLLVFAKPLNAPAGVLLAMFCAVALGSRVRGVARYCAWGGSAAIAAAAVTVFLAAPIEIALANTYNLVFLAIVPESRNSTADLQALGLDPKLRDCRGTGAYSQGTAYYALRQSDVFGKTVTPMKVLGFYLARPTRLWRHIQANLSMATSLRPEWYGNFEPSSGHPPGSQTTRFALWSTFHLRVLSRVSKFAVLALPMPALWALIEWIRGRRRLRTELAGLLGLCCLAAFLAAIFGDAWDTTRHLYLFNLLLDSSLLALLAAGVEALKRLSQGRSAQGALVTSRNSRATDSD